MPRSRSLCKQNTALQDGGRVARVKALAFQVVGRTVVGGGSGQVEKAIEPAARMPDEPVAAM
jgi:hypothetical protein